MTPQEEQLLNALIERVNQTQLQEKDPDADALLQRTLGSNRDALYILAQGLLVQNIALDQAKAQITDLQQQLEQAQQQAQHPARATSFLGGLFGQRDPEPAPPASAHTGYRPAGYQTSPSTGYQPVDPAYAAPQPGYAPQAGYAPPQYIPAAPSGGSGSSFLRGAAQTAAGVAAGALAFEGVEAVLHGLGGFGHSGYGWGGGGFGMGGLGMGGSGLMGSGFERPVEETVINNYYDDEPRGHESGGEHHFHESSDQGGAHFENASYDSSNDDIGSLDDASSYDDDGSGFDDSSSGNDDLL